MANIVSRPPVEATTRGFSQALLDQLNDVRSGSTSRETTEQIVKISNAQMRVVEIELKAYQLLRGQSVPGIMLLSNG